MYFDNSVWTSHYLVHPKRHYLLRNNTTTLSLAIGGPYLTARTVYVLSSVISDVTVETSPHVAGKPPERHTINNASSAADVARGSLFSTPFNQIQSPTARVSQHAAECLKRRDIKREKGEQETEHVQQNAQAAVLPLVV